jgi:hypothetical protein
VAALFAYEGHGLPAFSKGHARQVLLAIAFEGRAKPFCKFADAQFLLGGSPYSMIQGNAIDPSATIAPTAYYIPTRGSIRKPY